MNVSAGERDQKRTFRAGDAKKAQGQLEGSLKLLQI